MSKSAEAALQQLFAAAKAAQTNAYAPYSRFQSARRCVRKAARSIAAAMLRTPPIRKGLRRTGAISAMALAGDRRIAEILVIGDGEALCTPCGGCRQRIREFAAPDDADPYPGPEGVRASFTLAELLPKSSGPSTCRFDD